MSSKILSAALIGLDAEIVEVEADTGSGDYGKFVIVGLPDAAVSESKERVRSAIKNSGFEFPKVKVTVNLAPADLRKYGPGYDLPIAVGVLLASSKINIQENFKNSILLGELALDGSLRAVNGVLSVSVLAKKNKIKNVFVPKENAGEASLVDGVNVIAISDLREFVLVASGKKEACIIPKTKIDFQNHNYSYDMSHIKGQENVKRAMEIAAAGAHNMMMSGPPGSGKTLIAKTMPSILPKLNIDEALEITKIYSVSGNLNKKDSLIKQRPFRSPHHSSSGVALVGGGAWPKPGEISLAHRGVLFLDEFAEFPRQVLENLRQPIEDGVVNISRASGHLSFPARFILLTAMNPCPCGYYGDESGKCQCSEWQIQNYKRKISGPILDRIDLHITVPRVDFEKISSTQSGEKSVDIRKRVEEARLRQKERFSKEKILTNSEMNSEQVKRFCVIDEGSKRLLKHAMDKMFLSGRAYYRILKIARTIADIEGSEKITENNIAEALQYRQAF